ncbi:Uncharacterised protein [Amycolatopsis camponoti]|uniref:Uncharacterized protein n=1 Tax=Amycolatopsis camponoti TaxID=2606593 RepID=A0A6I8M3G7_9PSEU|nr:Uncharacterised protein [Amycolatopsis camponoti]
MNSSLKDLFVDLKRLEDAMTADPGDEEIRDRLARALAESTVRVRSLTRDRRPVMTTRGQREFCAAAADRIIELGAGGNAVQSAARSLRKEIEAGEAWTWRAPTNAFVLSTAAAAIGLVWAVTGGLQGDVGDVATASVLSSVALVIVTLRHRTRRWQIEADRVAALVCRNGL